VEPNLEQQTPKLPKLNVTNVSSAVFGKEGSALGKESKIGKLSRILRTTRIKVNTIEKILPEHQEVISSNAKKAFENARKITSIKNILKNQKSKVGEKLPKSNKENFVKTLAETNKILVEIQKQLASDFSMQVAEQKEDEQKEKKERSREKLKAEESALEKGRKKIGAALANTTKKVLSPFKGIFDQIKEFVMTVGAGIAVNAAFKWLSEEENRKKMEDAFTFLKNNWKWIAGVAAGLFLMSPIIGIVSSIISLGAVLFTIGSFIFSLLGAPVFLTLLGILAAAGGIYALSEFIKNRLSGGRGLRAAIEANEEKIISLGVGQRGPDGVYGGTGEIEDPNNPGKPLYAMTVMDGPKGARFRRIAKEGERGMLRRVTVETRTADGIGYVATEKQRAGFSAYQTNLKRFRAEKDAMDAEIKAARKLIITEKNIFGVATNAAQIADFDAKKAEIEKKYNQQYIDKYGDPTFGGVFNNLPGKRGGGSVTSGRPYLVGESGPELFMPRIDGTIVDNTRTERIYQVLASGRRGKMKTITLPPQVIEGPKPEVQMPLGAATKEPKISSSNPFDASRSMTSEIYGISV